MNAPFPLNPEVGEWSGNWVWNGARWVVSPTTGLRVLTHAFGQSGPYMPSPGLVSVTVECVGGGGGGGGSVSAQAGQVNAGAGGGSGGYSRKTLPAALVRGGVLVTVGDGGAGSGAGGTVQPTGAAGGATSFGALCLANGGMGGGSQNPGVAAPIPGAGGLSGIGDVTNVGNDGQPGYWQVWPNGEQITAFCPVGGSIWGGAHQEVIGPLSAVNGPSGEPNSGAGGSGAAQNQDPGGQAGGGNGGSGVCIVTEYVVGDRDQPVTEWRPPLDVNLNVTQRPPWPPRPPGPWWPPGWPPGWQPGSPWPPGWGPRPPWQPFEGQMIEDQEFEAGAEPSRQEPQDPEDP